MIVVMTDKQVSIEEEDNPHVGELIHTWAIDAFEAEFGVTRPERIAALNYEPTRGLYVLTTKSATAGQEHEVQVFADPSEHPVLAWVSSHLDDLRRSAEYQVLKAASPYPGDDYGWDGTKWVLTEDPNREGIDAIRWLAGHTVEMAVALSYLWEAAESKNVFAGVEIPAAVTNTIQAIITRRDKIS